MRVIQLGEKSDFVKLVQEKLNAKGYELAIDGWFGLKTLKALNDFRSKNNLVASKVIDNNALNLLGIVAAETPSSSSSTKGSKEWYSLMWRQCEILPEYQEQVVKDALLILKNKSRYEQVASIVNMPWYIIGAIHYKEAGCNFLGCLANGERIIGTGMITTIVPKGLGPYKTWEESAIDILKIKKLDQIRAWDIATALFHLERYNGTGYINGAGKEDTSPYLWARTNINDGTGLYVSDGKYDANASTSRSSGICAILKALQLMKLVTLFDEMPSVKIDLPEQKEPFTREKLALIAEGEARKNLVWAGPDSEAYKYTTPFIKIFGKGRFSWCAAFVRWCCVQAGLDLGIMPEKDIDFDYTWALVETWQQWAIKEQIYRDNNGVFVPSRGDIVIFDWSQKNINDPDDDWDDHIGVYLQALPNGAHMVAEGNASNQTAIKSRSNIVIQGYIRMPDYLQKA